MAELIVALDYPSIDPALELVDRLGSSGDFYKVGLELFTRTGPAILRELRARDKRVFLDLKLHDIPNTVAGAVHAAAAEDVDLLTLHCTGGESMLRAAAEAAGASSGRLRLLGVTVLTSLTPGEVEATWGRAVPSLQEEVLRLATLARSSGVDGVVASPLEAEVLKRALGADCLLVTPGIRLAGGDAHDQTRIATPRAAALAGADYIIVGRAITGAPDPEAACVAVLAELEAGVDEAGAAHDPREALR